MRLLLIIGMLTQLSLTHSFAQEICANGVDDDMDGLVDLNDPDCKCELLLPNSLIPNPSFEDRTCCPTKNAQLDCAVSWIQASPPTTDYVNTCDNYLGNTNIPAYAPLPFPDGEGGVGFRDGQEHVGPNYKEYVGACLTQPMVVGSLYRLDFFVGFRDNVTGSMNLDIAIFGSVNCNNLPFGGNSNTIGCPANTGLYKQISAQSVSGSDEWVNVVFEFYADQPYEVLILGPACASNPNYLLDPYFYLDRLTFAENSEFGEPFESIEGRICDNNLVLNVAFNPDNQYQWYLDGVALSGETGPSIQLTTAQYGEGIYQLRIIDEEGCYLSSEYDLRIPPYYETVQATICSNESYPFGSEELTDTGYYERLIDALDGCDSIIQLYLTVLPATESTVEDTICVGDQLLFHEFSFSEQGVHEVIISNSVNCDSTIQLDLTVIPEGDQFSLPDKIELDLGQTIDVLPTYIDPSYSDFYWTDEKDSILIEGKLLAELRPLNNTIVFFNAMDEFQCPVRDSVLIRVRKNNYILYLPNIFTPNGDGFNDWFNFKTPPSVAAIRQFTIFDRWGNKVFQSANPPFTGNRWGWDGTFKGYKAQIGVYTYLVDVLFIDGYAKAFSGDLTLIR